MNSEEEQKPDSEAIPGLSMLAAFQKIQSQEWLTSTCGKCRFFVQMGDRERIAMVGLNGPILGHCRESPPAVVVTGAQRMPNGQMQPAITMMYPNFPDGYPACSRYNPR